MVWRLSALFWGVIVSSRCYFRASPHLHLRTRQPTTHVTRRRSTHPGFASTLPIFHSLLVRSLPPLKKSYSYSQK